MDADGETVHAADTAGFAAAFWGWRQCPADSGDPDHPFQSIVITDSGDRDHAARLA